MKLTESQARRAVRKWLFEFATDSGVSHRMSTDDKIAGKLGDDREEQPASTIPEEIPIVATSQMSTQLTQAMPPVDDPNFVPGTLDELGKAVDLLSQTIPSSEIEWYYEKMQELADEAIVKGNKVDLSGGLLDGEMQLEPVVNPSTMSSQEAVAAQNENWNRWANMLMETLEESRYNRPGKMTTRMKNKKLTPQDMRLSYSEEDDDFLVSQEDLEDMADEFGEEDLSSLPGFDPSRHSSTRTSADIASGNFDGEAKLRELVDLGIYPSVRTMSGMRKKIKAEIDPVVQMMVTAKPAFDWLIGWYNDERQLSWNGKQVAGPDVYKMAIDAWAKHHKKNPAKLDELAAAIESGGFYTECLAEIVMAPIVRKWIQSIKAGTIDVSSRKVKNNFQMSDWILETVLNSGFGKSGPRRRAGKVQNALDGMNEFKSAMDAVASETDETPGEET